MAESAPTMLTVPANEPFAGTQTPLSDTTLSSPPNEKASISDLEKHEEAPALLEKRTVTGIKWFVMLTAVYSTALLYGLDTTIVADIQASAVETFGHVEQLSWIGIGFPLGSIAVILAVGKAYGVFDIKWVFIGSIILFEVGSALCGGAPSMNALIVGRVIAGAGGAGIYLGALNILSTLTTPRERPVYISLIGVCWGVGTILGPVIGGAFADSPATWRWAFYINLVLAAIMAPAYLFLIPSMNPQPDKTLVEKLKKMDWLGMLLNAGIYVCWVMGLTFGGAQWAWSDGRTIAVFVVCGVLIIAFALQQRFAWLTTVADRIFPCAFLAHKTLIILFFQTACSATALFVPVYYIPLFFQFTKNDTALDAAVRLLPFIVVCIVSIMVNGALMPKFGYYLPWYIAAGAFTLVGGALMYTVDASSSSSRVYGYSILVAIGSGIACQAAYSVASVKVAMNPAFGPAMVPDAIGFVNTAQIGSIVHALAISGTVFQNLSFQYLKSALGGMGYSDAELRGALLGTMSPLFTSASEQTRELAIDAIVKAMDRVYILVIAAGAFGLVTSVFLKREKLFMEMGAGGG